MNYQQLVVSKTPDVYVTYNGSTNVPIIGETFLNSTSGNNPTYPYDFKKQGARSKRTGATVGNYTHRVYRQFAPTGVGVKCYYWHQEFFIYLVGVPSSQFNVGGLGYSNVSPSGTLTTTASMRITAGRLVDFTTANNTGTENNVLFSNSTIPVGSWTHIALQYDYGVKRIYINGVLDNSVSTGFVDGVGALWYEPLNTSRGITYVDEVAWWSGRTTTKPANYPTAADILQRATFPMTKTKWWDPATSSFITSADELYWNGTAWESMQDKTYQYWNGTSWVTL